MSERVGRIVIRDGVRYKLVPPEGGWGYMICLSMAIQFTALFSMASSFGLIYNEFLLDLHEGTSGVTFVHGTHCIAVSVSAFASNALLKRLSLRQVSLLGSGIFCVGTFLGVFVKSLPHVLVTNGLIQASGIGLAFPISYTAFNSYFTKKRLTYLSVIKLIIGSASVFVPLLVQLSMDEFGFRGTLIMINVMALHSVLASLMLQPVEWHLKAEKLREGEDDEALLNSDRRKVTQSRVQSDYIGDKTVDMKKEKEDNNNSTNLYGKTDLANTVSESELNNHISKETNVEKDRRFSYDVNHLPDNDYIKYLVKASSIISFSQPVVEPLPAILDIRERLQLVVDYFDLSLLKDLVYTNIVIGMAFAMFADGTFLTLLPLYLYNIGWHNGPVARAMALVAAGDMIGRILLVILSKVAHDNSRYIYLTGMFATGLLRCVFAMVSGETAYLILLTGIGSARCLMHVTSPLVLADQVPIRRYPAAYSLYMLVYGFINVVGGPLVGMIRDITGSYPLVFNILTAIILTFAAPWVIELYLRRRKEKNENCTSGKL